MVVNRPKSDSDVWWVGENPARLERAVLGSCMIAPELVEGVARFIADRDLSSEAHRTIWRVIKGLHDQGLVPDLLTVLHELYRRGRIDLAGGTAYLTSLVDNIPSVDLATQYAQTVRECAAMRRVKKEGP